LQLRSCRIDGVAGAFRLIAVICKSVTGANDDPNA
jgi:hypothetical protein